MGNLPVILNWFVALAFMATTVVTLLGLVGVIRIEKSFLNRLFVVLILEIVAAGFSLIKQAWTPEQEYFHKARALMDEAVTARKLGDVDQADRLLGQILTLSVANLPFEIRQVFRERGSLMADKKNWEAVVRSLNVYYEINPDDFDVLIQYGRGLREINRYSDADQVYQRAAQLSPNNFDVLNGLQNISRRLGAFYLDSDRIDAADTQFERTRDLINRMLNTVGDKALDPVRYRLAVLARARLYWEWRRYSEAINAYENAATEFPDYMPVQEDLAAVNLEAGERGGDTARLVVARNLYRQFYLSRPKGSDVVFNGAGFAEAAALAQDTTPEMLIEAEKAVLTSFTDQQTALEDPYTHYAAAMLYDRLKQRPKAQTYLANAIRYERRRANDPYKFDYIRLVKYERLQERWHNEPA